jgi:hypothetical protein
MGPLRAQIYRRDLASGRVERVREIVPPDPVGALGVEGLLLSPDGLSYDYICSRSVNTLYLVEGLK